MPRELREREKFTSVERYLLRDFGDRISSAAGQRSDLVKTTELFLIGYIKIVYLINNIVVVDKSAFVTLKIRIRQRSNHVPRKAIKKPRGCVVCHIFCADKQF